MKSALHLLLSLSVLLFAACKKDNISKKSEYDDSYEKFQAFKKSSANTYSYVAASGSVFGVSSSTTISVINGQVVSRSYKRYQTRGNGGGNVLVTSWTEDKATLGSHTEGYQALTLDKVYEQAKNVWLKADKKANDIYFEVDANGLISSCGYVPKGCQDDCFTGITISSISTVIADYAK
ncbi:hypothetical protein [Mucilaginibacter agri]|uniref:Lipoprotein n=1 Tax=Mucilaginibacter agri TaxID=2695265 RepID=A0A966DU25_9SPHI|nr:hypothetical protein [Mucilaginibacter agri]NCD71933.1 hypothetical protein [Mucilaginibacter agri]